MCRERGITVIEVLVAVVVVSLGIVGALAALGRAFSGNDSSGYRAQASWLASTLIERARSNVAEDYSIQFFSPTAGSGQASIDLTAWKAQLARALPAGDGRVVVTSDVDPVTGVTVRKLRVTVAWEEWRAVNIYRQVSVDTYLQAP